MLVKLMLSFWISEKLLYYFSQHPFGKSVQPKSTQKHYALSQQLAVGLGPKAYSKWGYIRLAASHHQGS